MCATCNNRCREATHLEGAALRRQELGETAPHGRPIDARLLVLDEPTLGLDIRYVVTSLSGTVKYLYETVYCGRGQAENFIKLHKAQLASDRTSCRDPRANQMRLILHTAAYWLLHTLRAAAPKRSRLRTAGT